MINYSFFTLTVHPESQRPASARISDRVRRCILTLQIYVHSVVTPVTIKMSHPIAESIEDGQFDDAPEDTVETPNAPQTVDLREGHNYIDDENILEWSEDSSDEEEDTFDLEEDQMEAEAFETLRAEDEDWEIAERGM